MKQELLPERPIDGEGDLLPNQSQNLQGEPQSMEQILEHNPIENPELKEKYFPSIGEAQAFLQNAKDGDIQALVNQDPEHFRRALAVVLPAVDVRKLKEESSPQVAVTLSFETKLNMGFNSLYKDQYDLYDLGHGDYFIRKIISLEPKFVKEIQKKRTWLPPFKKNVVTMRDAKPEEQKPFTNVRGHLYTDPPREEFSQSRHGHAQPPIRKGFEKVNRESCWIVTVSQKEDLEEMKLVAEGLAEAFPHISIEVLFTG